MIKSLTRAFAIAAVLLIVAVAWFVLTFDPNDYRAAIADAISRAIDRRVAISGDIEITPALVPTLAVNDVTIANPPWAARPIMASAGRLEVTLALLPLLEGQIQIRHAALEGVDVRLERDAAGRGNWELAFLTDADAAESAGRYETEIAEVELRAIDVGYAAADGTELGGRIERIGLRRLPSGAFAIEGAGRLGELPVVVRWEAGPLDERGDDPELRWPVSARAEIGDTALTMTGRLRAPLAYARSALELRIAGRDAHGWRLANLPRGETSAYTIGGNVRIDERSVRITGLRGELAGGGIVAARLESGRVTLARGERIEATLDGLIAGVPFAVSARLGTLAELAGERPWPVGLAATLGDARLEATGEVASAPSGRASLEVAVNGEVFETLKRVVPWPLPNPGPMTLASRLELEPARVSLDGLTIDVAAGTVAGAIEVRRAAGRLRVAADLRARSLDLGRLPSAAPAAGDEPLLDRALPLDWLERADATVALAIDELRGLPFPLRGLAGRASLADGALQLVVDEAQIAGVAAAGSARLGRVADRARFDLTLQAPAIDLDRLLAALGAAIELDLEASARAAALELHTTGTSLREAADASTATLSAGPVELGLVRGARAIGVQLAMLRIETAPRAKARLEAAGRLSAATSGRPIEPSFELTATAGTLAELLSAEQPWAGIEVAVASEYRGEPITITGRIADAASLIERERVDVSAEVSWGAVRANVAAGVLPSPGLAGSTAEVAVVVDDFAAAGELFGVSGLPAGGAAVAARAAIGERELTLAMSEIAAPGLRGAGELHLERDAAPALRGRLDLALLDLTPYLAHEAAASPAGETIALHRLYSAQRLELEPLHRWNIELDVAADVLRFGGFTSHEASLDLQLGAGTLDVDAALDGGRMRGHLRIDADSAMPEISLQASGAAVALALERDGEPAAGTPVIDFTAALSGRGESSQALVRSLAGDLLVYLRGGRIESGGLRFLFGSVLYQLLDVINPFSERQSYVDIECAGVYFDVVGGVVATEKGFILQTPELQIVGVGNANLANGELTMRFRTKRRTGIVVSIGGIVNEFVQLTGTLDAPRVELSPERAARTGVLALATGGLSLLATDLFNRVTAKDVCPELPAVVGAPGASE